MVPVMVAAASAVAMSLALPRSNVWVLAPAGAAALFWVWFGSSPRRAFLMGLWAGAIYFSLAFSWFAQTAGAYIAPFGFSLVLAPALLEALAFAATGALVAYAWKSAPRPAAPLAAAAAFAGLEWLRSIGPLGLPFGNLSYSQAESPFAPLAPYVGSFGITFALCVLAAYCAAALRRSRDPSLRRAAGLAALGVLAGLAAAWQFWPARAPAAVTTRVAAVQGNIPQTIKWTPAAFALAEARYTRLTTAAGAFRPRLILWPETVMTLDLNLSPATVERLGLLARRVSATMMVGAKEATPTGEYNALYVFRPDGSLGSVYRKRLLVPFVETLPAPWLFGRLPVAALISRFGAGESSGVTDIGGLRVAPLICWESAFDDAAHRAMRDGAQALVVATDDAWFGTTAGPFQHAEIAQMRALENGTWIVRAAATGVSGIVAPNGRYVGVGPLGAVRIVRGEIGPSVRTPYARAGAGPFALAFFLLYGVLAAPGRRRR